jgi:hypothetical protein
MALVITLAVSVSLVEAVDLQDRTSSAFDRYSQEASQNFVRRATATGAPGDSANSNRPGRDGIAHVQPGAEDGIITVPGGLVHHWKGAAFIHGASLDEALSLSRSYADYSSIYKSVVGSSLLGRDGDTYHVKLRIKESAGGLSAVLDVTTRVRYVFPSENSAYSISTADDIREVERAGTPGERQLPPGRDSGYLWRAMTLNRLVQQQDGLAVEVETLGLSRSFPKLLGWIIEPIARRLGRKTIEGSIQEFRSALLKRRYRDGRQ